MKIESIDKTVSRINNSELPIEKDTITQDFPALNLHMTTFLTAVYTDKELFKYQNFGFTNRIEKGTSQKIETSTTFYFENNSLIKVEEYGILDDGDKKEFTWYFYENQPLNSYLFSEKEEARATQLIELATGLLRQMIK
jgi:hypothetical protein